MSYWRRVFLVNLYPAGNSVNYMHKDMNGGPINILCLCLNWYLTGDIRFCVFSDEKIKTPILVD